MSTRLSVFVPVLLSLFLSAPAAAEGKVRLVDPHGAAVAGARVTVFVGDKPVASANTSGAGVVHVDLPPGARVEVLASGFAPLTHHVIGAGADLELQLRPAAQPDTVVVIATLAPLATEETGRAVSLLRSDELAVMQPLTSAEALRFIPGTVVNAAGRRGGLASLFVRGGESRYNRVLIDGVPVNEAGGTFDFGAVPMIAADRVELMRGAESTLYGSDAMTSVVQFFSAAGRTRLPEFRFGAEGGNLATARGYASVAGAHRALDYNLFGEQTNTDGQGTNDEYSNSAAGVNAGVALGSRAFLRFRTRHSNSRTGVQGFWRFEGRPVLPPDTDGYARQNNLLLSAELTAVAPVELRHRLRGYEYRHRRLNVDRGTDAGRVSPLFGPLDFPFEDFAHFNRAGLEYQGEFSPRAWTRTTFGYELEKENGRLEDRLGGTVTPAVRVNHSVFLQQGLVWRRASLIAGGRYVNNGAFGSRWVPRIAATLLVSAGNSNFSGTRLRAAYGQGIKAPRFDESLGGTFVQPNPDLKPEENRSYEAGVQQGFLDDRLALHATYFRNRFRNQIAFSFDPVTFAGRYVNVNRSMAHGAEIEFTARPAARVSVSAGYVHVSSQIEEAPFAFDPLLQPGRPLLRRPRHSGSVLTTYSAPRWGVQLGGSFVGRRPDSDFVGLVPAVTSVGGYARIDAGAWLEVNRFATAYANLGNLLNQEYEEVAGYPALGAHFRAGMRFRFGGE